MMRLSFQRSALILFWIYLAVFPGSTIVVALNRVPEWGAWMGGALLLLQGAAALCWLIGTYGTRGGLAALLVFLLAWAVEYIGVITGIPFGRYRYTGALQPQLFSTVPLAIPFAWLMVAAGAWQLATNDPSTPRFLSLSKGRAGDRPPTTDHRLFSAVVGRRWSVVVAATLVLLLDLQIETIATKVNRYWIWQDSGPYYGVPTGNFVAWWLVGLAMALAVAKILPERSDGARLYVSRLVSRVSGFIPAHLYLLNTLMFAIVNLARGYTIAGLVGALTLLAVTLRALPAGARQPFFSGVEQIERAE